MDSRDIAALTKPWWTSLDKRRMMVIVALCDYEDDEHFVHVPFKYGVCGLCGGKGSHVNPSIDSEGLTAEDFAQDPDFEEGYFAGDYDQPCNACGGERVVPVADAERCDPVVLKAIHDQQAADYEYACQSAHERKMGY